MNIIIFGSGKIAKKLMSYPLKANNRVIMICDNDREKWGVEFCGYIIENPNNIRFAKFDCVLIAAGYGAEDMKRQLVDMGILGGAIIMPYGLDVIEYCKEPLDEIFEIQKKALIPFKKGPAVIYKNFIGETARSAARRKREGFFEKYCQGEGIDIGYGADLIVPGCSGWDARNGDAQYLDGVENESFDFAYSSHCLEHMMDIRIALQNWFRVIRPGGYLIVAIPHRDLYEKKQELPSRWNPDHKHMFLIGKAELPDTLDIVEEIRKSLENYEIQYVKACDEGHTITDPLQHSDGEYQIEMVIRKLPKRS